MKKTKSQLVRAIHELLLFIGVLAFFILIVVPFRVIAEEARMSIPKDAKPGQYQFRMFPSDDDSFDEVAYSSSFRVVERAVKKLTLKAPSLIIAKTKKFGKYNNIYYGYGIYLKWNDPNRNVTHWQVQYSLDNIDWNYAYKKIKYSHGSWVNHHGDNIFGKYTKNLNSGATYYYRVRSCNSSGCSSWSNIKSATIPGYSKTISEFTKRLVLEDTFIDNRNHWYIDDKELYIRGGKYNIDARSSDHISYNEYRILKDGRIRVKAIWKEGKPGMAYGLMFRRKERLHFYMFVINAYGKYSLACVDGGKAKPLIGWTKSNELRVKGKNTIEVELQGNLITGYINGKKVFSKYDSKYSTGPYGFFVSKGVHAQFDDLRVWEYVVRTSDIQTSTLFEDNFSRASTLSANWEIHDAKNPAGGPSQWVIQNGELWQKSNIYRSGPDEYDFFEGTHTVTKQGINWTNYEISVDFRISGDNDGVGVLFRYRDAEHYYRFITVEDSANHGPFRRIQVKDGDKYITLAESKEGYDPSMSHNIRIRVVGENITVFFDGQRTLSAKDSRYASGRIGLQAYAEQPVFDNIKVSAIKGS